MQALVKASQNWPAQVIAVISNRPQAPGLQWAKDQGIATKAIDHTSFEKREQFDAALLNAVREFKPDWVLLAGFMRVLAEDFVAQFAGRLINIHPSLLPAFPGLKTHERALASGVSLHGATVHQVTSQLDHGPVLTQGATKVLPSDSPQSLARRVQAIEHLIYVDAVKRLLTHHPLTHPQLAWKLYS